MQVIIENAGVCDYRAVGGLIINELGYAGLDLEQLKIRMEQMLSDGNYETFVARHDGAVVGFIGLCKGIAFETEGKYMRIIAFAVESRCQNKGIGTMLLNKAEQYARENSINLISVSSGLQREAAHGFYETKGFTKKGYTFKKTI
jgi:GNAT superfamily N-acetyltransferase